ncbi:MAG: hypothetical protein HY334_05665, partial [Armatimonadetes bacterium]|nr:hypothetical protein [Armatimonadota bacterium]
GVAALGREGARYTIRLRAGAYLPEPVQRRLRVAYGGRIQVTPAVVTVRVTGGQFSDQVAEVREILEAIAHFLRQPAAEPLPAH